MDKVMEAALAEVNATRKDTSHTRNLADAHLDYRVRLADIRDEYDAAVALAKGNAERARRRAEHALEVATARAAVVSAERRAQFTRFQSTNGDLLVQLYRHVRSLLAPAGAAYLDRDKRPELVCTQRMLARILTQRGYDLDDL